MAWPAAALAEKTDVVVLKNGDKITGEVKGLSRGKLDYSTDDAGRLAIEWVKVARLSSPRTFEVETSSGLKYFGRIPAAEQDGVVAIQDGRADTLAIPSVVRINTLDAGFFQRTKAYLDMGLSYAKANRATTFNMSGEAAYRGSKFGGSLSFDSYAQGQESDPTTARNSLGFQVNRFLPKRWSAIALARTEQNDELNLDLRLTGAGVLGRALLVSNSAEIGAGVGLAVTRERFLPTAADTSGDNESSTSLEAVLAGQYDAFRFDSPKLDFSTSLYLFPSLSTAGRIRGEFGLRLKYELLADFNVGISATDTFDSDPPEEGADEERLPHLLHHRLVLPAVAWLPPIPSIPESGSATSTSRSPISSGRSRSTAMCSGLKSCSGWDKPRPFSAPAVTTTMSA